MHPHKHPAIPQQLARHRRGIFHFTPKSASQFIAVEGVYAAPTKSWLKRGVFRSIAGPQAAINHFLDKHNTGS